MFLTLLSTAILLIVLFMPLFLYLAYGWQVRKRQLLSLFPDAAVSLYYNAYFPAEKSKPTDQVEFERDFNTRYGRQHYVFPSLVLLIVSTFFMVISVDSVIGKIFPDASASHFQLPPVAIACLAGAYVWVVYDFILRNRSLDFATTHVDRASFRLVVSVPLAFTIPQLWGEDVRIPLAFLLGAFPSDQLMRFLRRQASQRFGIGETQEDQLSKLESLQSVDSSTADRFREEGITTIAQLGNCDPVALTIRTGFSFSFIFDCISEAIAWYFLQKDRLVVVQAFSLPGALEIYGLIDELDYQDNPQDPQNARYLDDKRLARETLTKLAVKLQTDEAVLERIFRTIWDDSRTDFLAHLCDAMQNIRAAARPTV